MKHTNKRSGTLSQEMKVALMLLRNTKHRLTKQQYKTVLGQILAGDSEGAMKGLQSITNRGRIPSENERR